MALKRLVSTECRQEQRRVLDEIDNELFHQGWSAEAAVPAMPILLDILDAGGLNNDLQSRLLSLVTNLFVGFDDDSLPPRKLEEQPNFDGELYSTVNREGRRFLSLLNIPETRSAALRFFAWLPALAEESLPQLRRHCTSDDMELRAGAYTARALLGDMVADFDTSGPKVYHASNLAMCVTGGIAERNFLALLELSNWTTRESSDFIIYPFEFGLYAYACSVLMAAPSELRERFLEAATPGFLLDQVLFACRVRELEKLQRDLERVVWPGETRLRKAVNWVRRGGKEVKTASILSRLCSHNARALEELEELADLVCRDGLRSIQKGEEPVLIFLLRLVSINGHESGVVEALLDLLVRLALAQEESCLGTRGRTFSSNWDRECHELVAGEAQRFLPFLDSPDISVRVSACRAVAWFPGIEGSSLPRLRELAKSDLEAERIVSKISMALLGSPAPPSQEDTARASLVSIVSHCFVHPIQQADLERLVSLASEQMDWSLAPYSFDLLDFAAEAICRQSPNMLRQFLSQARDGPLKERVLAGLPTVL